jgi:hypothetical protein
MTDLPAGDPVVRRANDLATSALDVLGSLLLAAAAGWWAWSAVHPALGLAVAGAGRHRAVRARPVARHPAIVDAKLGVGRRRSRCPARRTRARLHVMGR